MLSFVGLSVSATVLFLLGRCYAVYHWQNLVFSSQAVGFARMLSSVREVAAHTEAAQVDCCGLRTCCISWRRIVAGLNKKSIMSVIWRNEVWHCIRRSLPQTLQICGTKRRHFFLAQIRTLNLVILCSAWKIYSAEPFGLTDHCCGLPGTAQLPPCSEMGARSKEQNTPYCFKNPNLDYTILKMKVSRMVT